MSSNMKQLVAVTKRDGQDKGYWTRIGTAFENRDGSWSLMFDYFPTDMTKTRIQLRDVDRREKSEDRPEKTAADPNAQRDAVPADGDDVPF